eukprot:6702047-Prymnesium_polylepis.1
MVASPVACCPPRASSCAWLETKPASDRPPPSWFARRARRGRRPPPRRSRRFARTPRAAARVGAAP